MPSELEREIFDRMVERLLSNDWAQGRCGGRPVPPRPPVAAAPDNQPA